MPATLPSTYTDPIHLAIIGGTGVSALSTLTPLAILPRTHPDLQTPWGAPSSPITILSYTPAPPTSTTSTSTTTSQATSPPPPPPPPPLTIAFLLRHGPHHALSPSEVPSRANIAALRRLGIRCILAFSAVGSLRHDLKPRDFLIPTQIYDRTTGVRPWTFFEPGVVAHVPFADPFDDALGALVQRAVVPGTLRHGGGGGGEGEGEDVVRLHRGGTVVCIEGPQFSTRAESHAYRLPPVAASAINMSALPEAKLAREAEMAYAMVCMSTDYDAWHATHEAVSVDMVMGHVRANAENALRVVGAVLAALARGLAAGEGEEEEVRGILAGARWKGQSFAGVCTAPEGWGREAVEKLAWLFPEEFGPAAAAWKSG